MEENGLDRKVCIIFHGRFWFNPFNEKKEWVTSKGGILHVAQAGLNVRECDVRDLEF